MPWVFVTLGVVLAAISIAMVIQAREFVQALAASILFSLGTLLVMGGSALASHR